MLNFWLRDSYNSNLTVFETIFGTHNFRFSERFPRMTLCKFNVYILTDQQPQWVQCALPINIYIEKAYMIIWSWLWILLVIITIDIIMYIINYFRSYHFIRKRLTDLNLDEQIFLANSLTKDGILTLKLVKSNTNDFYVNAILSNLVDFYSIRKNR